VLKARISRRRTKARTTKTLIPTALGLFKIVAAMMEPCSVKTNGENLGVAVLLGTGRNLRPVQGLGLDPIRI
jgi:hypothetical protein